MNIPDERLFHLQGHYAPSWREQAGLLKMSGDLIAEKFYAVAQSSTPPKDKQTEMLSYMQSAMLLRGLALENLLKGVDIAIKPDIVSNGKFDLKSFPSGGHGIVEMVSRLKGFTASRDEADLIERLQEYVKWAGKYPIPKDANVYDDAVNKGLRSMKPHDADLLDALFARLSTLLDDERTNYKKNNPHDEYA